MFFGPHRAADMRHQKVIQLPTMSDFEQLTKRQPVLRELAELSGSEPRTTKLAVRRMTNTGAVMDFGCEAYLTLPVSQQFVLKFFPNSQAPIVMIAPALVAATMPAPTRPRVVLDARSGA